MTALELYKLWAPDSSIWMNWVKPVLFTVMRHADDEPPQITEWSGLNVAWAPLSRNDTAIVLDLPGAEGVCFAMALGQGRGFRPVPLYNGVPGRSSVVDVTVIVTALHKAEATLTDLLVKLPEDAPPVFLLDSDRQSGGSYVGPGQFDNRWCVFPQDFPSANFLLSRGINRVVLGQKLLGPPQTDLAHVLLRWQEAGIQIFACDVNATAPPTPIQVSRPKRFRTLWYAALMMVGLRRNSAGGFGTKIPMPSAGTGGGFA